MISGWLESLSIILFKYYYVKAVAMDLNPMSIADVYETGRELRWASRFSAIGGK